MNLLEGKKIVIIGGTTGMGLSAAKAFIANGANVVIVGRHEDTVISAQQEVGEKGIALAGDAIDAGTAAHAIDVCLKTFNGFTGLYHVAGGSGRKMGDGPLHELTLEGWNATMQMNLTSLMLSNRAAVKKFLELKSAGTILNMSSVLGFSPSPKYFSTHA
ncbi:MAG TPA: SDR family oxidoreductase, partial [Chitinophagaceae bacterium]|nr:SDR family oxidoreductase [Chitinophagaceae bacterium]